MTGKALIDQYLREKDPYASCGLLVIDVDFFKNVNDRYGHLFGDKVLQELAHLLQTLFSKKDILVRAGGDEFLVFLKDVDHATLLNKTRQLSESVRKIPFSENDYCLTCSIGACFLPENVSGYFYTASSLKTPTGPFTRPRRTGAINTSSATTSAATPNPRPMWPIWTPPGRSWTPATCTTT